jgi:hypothetical protein
MAILLSEAAKFSTNMVKKGVLKTIIKDSIVLQKLPFIDIVGNAYQYLREADLKTGRFYDPNEQWQEDTPTFTQLTAAIKILGGDSDIDEFLKATRSDKTDLEAEVIEARAKGVKHTFLDTFFYGSVITDSKAFDGLHKIHQGADMAGQTINQGVGTAGAPLSLDNLDKLVDLVRDGPPDCLLMTRNIRRRLTQYYRAQGSINTDRDEFGRFVENHGGIPIYSEDMLLQTEAIAANTYTAKTGGLTSSIFAPRFGSNDLVGLQNGGLETKKLGQLELKDATRWRIKWYVGLALMRNISSARIDGITDAAVVA